MDICYKCEIVFNEKGCPLCKANVRVTELEEDINRLETEIKNMEVL